MKPLQTALAIWAAALWWGGLTTVGFGVVPMLFAHLPTPAMAGAMAAKLFTALTWLTVVCGLLLLVFFRRNEAEPLVGSAQRAILFVVTGILLALLSEYAIAPRIVAKQDLHVWHSVGTVMYALQWLCATVTLKHLVAGRESRA